MTIKLKLNQSMSGYSAGQTVTIQTDSAGVPLEKFWRRRLKDSKIDNCVEEVKPSKPKKQKMEKSE